ncbi:hypothetical protein D9758_013330 [Tetrapyrgos nigripes]|uniref:HTH APSES-type domain-containing protein n=1 Tax=Tetrapyrgos nigripes TaxID=182062 RepID=A0A8H5FJN9_9AGAR|nr:hypothetical protein D9758_013330 [Tetrapyrgos nigripes]
MASAQAAIYEAVYSDVMVDEMLVRGVAVMRRRADFYVNATQILKVAGYDKSTRLRLLEREVNSGGERMQGGHSKYQGTWVSISRGREIASESGVLPELAPLFDYQANEDSFTAPAASLFLPLTGSYCHETLGAPPMSSDVSAVISQLRVAPGTSLQLLRECRERGLFVLSASNPQQYRSPLSFTPPQQDESFQPSKLHSNPATTRIRDLSNKKPTTTRSSKQSRSGSTRFASKATPLQEATNVHQSPTGADGSDAPPSKLSNKRPLPTSHPGYPRNADVILNFSPSLKPCQPATHLDPAQTSSEDECDSSDSEEPEPEAEFSGYTDRNGFPDATEGCRSIVPVVVDLLRSLPVDEQSMARFSAKVEESS